jgi:hypothetical protein
LCTAVTSNVGCPGALGHCWQHQCHRMPSCGTEHAVPNVPSEMTIACRHRSTLPTPDPLWSPSNCVVTLISLCEHCPSQSPSLHISRQRRLTTNAVCANAVCQHMPMHRHVSAIHHHQVHRDCQTMLFVQMQFVSTGRLRHRQQLLEGTTHNAQYEIHTAAGTILNAHGCCKQCHHAPRQPTLLVTAVGNRSAAVR